MKTFSTSTGLRLTENDCDINVLRNLETRVKEVTTRKPCRCNSCYAIIDKKERALKTAQRHHLTDICYNAYCSECYREETP